MSKVSSYFNESKMKKSKWIFICVRLCLSSFLLSSIDDSYVVYLTDKKRIDGSFTIGYLAIMEVIDHPINPLIYLFILETK